MVCIAEVVRQGLALAVPLCLPFLCRNANFERQERGPRERWEFAIAGVMAEQRVVSTYVF